MDKQISNIVFTKNRPLQLEGYLDSLYRNFKEELIQTYILYKQELFDDEYQQVFERYSDCVVIKETDFFSDFLEIINGIGTKYILFGVDDVVYFDNVDLGIIDETFSKFSDNIFGFSLRFNERNIRDSGDPLSSVSVAGEVVYSIDWTKGRTPTTRYPFELCATIYTADIVKKVIYGSRNNNPLLEKLFAPGSPIINAMRKISSPRKILKSFGYFFSPNTLESWNCRWCQNNTSQLPASIYFQKLCASAIQVNMVNTSTNNEVDNSAEYSVEALNEKYKQGCRLDIDFVVSNKPTHSHCGKESFILTKGSPENIKDVYID